MLHDLGFKLFGPIIGSFIYEVTQKIIKKKKNILLFHREGYFFYKLLDNHFKRCGYFNYIQYLKELKVSRAFLFKLLLSDPKELPLCLEHPYKGSLLSFLKNRFALTESDCSLLKYNFMDTTVNLPEDKEFFIEIIYEITKPLHKDIEIKKNIYYDYINILLNKEKTVSCLDIGFSGTIQKILSRLYNFHTNGYYMYLSKDFIPEKKDSFSYNAEGILSNVSKHGEGNPLIDYSLVLECLLTSYNGQLLDIYYDKNIHFIYKKQENTQKYFYYLSPIIDGVDFFIEKMYENNISGNELIQILDIKKLYEIYLKYNNSPEMIFLKKFIEIDDSISGNNIINPFNFINGIH